MMFVDISSHKTSIYIKMSVKGMVVVMTFSVMAWKSVGLKWTTEALHTNSCEGQDTKLMWNYSLEKNETVQDNQWFFQSTQIAYESESMKFLVSPLYKGRVEQISKMGIRLKNVSSLDTGNYSLYLNLDPESPEIMQRIFLTVFESPTFQCKPNITKYSENVLFCSTNSCGRIQLSTEWRRSEKYDFLSNSSYLKINSSWNDEHVSCCLHRQNIQCQNGNLSDFCTSTIIAEDKHAPDSGYTANSVKLTATVIVLALIIFFSAIVFVIHFCYRKKKCRLCAMRCKEEDKEQEPNIEPEALGMMEDAMRCKEEDKEQEPNIEPEALGMMEANSPAAAAATTGSIKSSTPTTPTGGRVHSIASLTTDQNRWRIRARVTQKGNIYRWSNSQGNGKLFSVNLVDESGEIKATGFNDAVDKFFYLLEVNKVFYISRATLKTANKQYSNVKNDYEMTFNNDTCIEPCEDDLDLPSVTFNFVKINELEKIQPNGLVDVIGKMKQCGDVSTVIRKQSPCEVAKREVQLVDQSGMVVALTMWGQDAESFDGSGNPVLAIKGVKVSDWGGRSLSVLPSSQLIINPDIQEARQLRDWYAIEGSSMDFAGFKSEMGSGASAGELRLLGQSAILQQLTLRKNQHV